MRKALKRLIALALGGAGAVGAGEVGLAFAGLPDDSRVFAIMGSDAHCFQRDAQLLWRLRQDATLYRPNRLGLRGYWPARDERGDRMRIVCVGDSCTFAVGGRFEDGYGARLEQRLHERFPHRGFEVLLAALPGHSTCQNRALFELEVVGLEPDVVIVYASGWNDARPALYLPDAEYLRAEQAFDRALWSGLRSARFVRQAVIRRRTAAARENADQPQRPRVALEEFIGHVTAMARGAKAARATPLFLVPPLPRATVAARPALENYRAAVRRVAAAEGVAAVDGELVFRQHDAALPAAVRAVAGEASPCFADYVHPSGLGHRLLADALVAAIAEHVGDGPTGGAAVQIENVRAVSSGALELVGTGFAGVTPADRVWLGPHWLRQVRVVDDRRLQVQLPKHLPPGEHVVSLRTARGAVRGPAWRVAPRSLAVHADATAKEVLLRIEDCPPSVVRVWFATELADEPRRTEFGPFALMPGQPPGVADLPVRWGELSLPALEGRQPQQGVWEKRVPVDVPLTDAAVYAQALLADPDEPFEGALTTAVRVVIDG
ncbi:MAG: SGNH/GDSL hydrolase family protein [Planctomycetota bacterium]